MIFLRHLQFCNSLPPQTPIVGPVRAASHLISQITKIIRPNPGGLSAALFFFHFEMEKTLSLREINTSCCSFLPQAAAWGRSPWNASGCLQPRRCHLPPSLAFASRDTLTDPVHEEISPVLSRCPRLGGAALSFYLREAGALAGSPAGIYRGALDPPLPLAPAPLHPGSTRPGKRGVKGIFCFAKGDAVAILQ